MGEVTPLPADEMEEVKALHVQTDGGCCDWCEKCWPCDIARLLAAVERYRQLEEAAQGFVRSLDEFEEMVRDLSSLDREDAIRRYVLGLAVMRRQMRAALAADQRGGSEPMKGTGK